MARCRRQRDWPGPFGSSCRRCCQRQSSTCQMRAVVTRGDFDRHHRWARDGGARAEAWCRFNRSHWLPKMSQRYSQCCCLSLVCISGGQSARTRSSIRFFIFLNSFIFIFFFFFPSFLLIIFKKKKVFSTLFLSLFGIREITAAAQCTRAHHLPRLIKKVRERGLVVAPTITPFTRENWPFVFFLSSIPTAAATTAHDCDSLYNRLHNMRVR